MRKIQSGDKVKVISGKYKGILGQVTKVVTKLRPGKLPQLRAAVNNIPKIVKFKKKNVAFNVPGEQLETDRLIDLSNLSLVTEDGAISKVKFEIKGDKKVRILKKNGAEVVSNFVSKKKLIATTEEKISDKKETKKKVK